MTRQPCPGLASSVRPWHGTDGQPGQGRSRFGTECSGEARSGDGLAVKVGRVRVLRVQERSVAVSLGSCG